MSRQNAIKFKFVQNVNNPKSIHGIFPYRGKISPIDAINILIQLPKKGVLLDPFCGSGTIIYEAKKLGHCVIGVDSNPIAIQISKGKFCEFDINESIQKIRLIIKKIEKMNRYFSLPDKVKKYFHEKTGSEIMNLKEYYDEFNDYEKAVFLGTICLAARGCNHYKWSSTQIGQISNDKKYINFYEKFLTKLRKHYYPVNSIGSQIILSDSRQLTNYLREKSVDYVYTSPPYFDALDYTSNYTRLVHLIFNNDVEDIRKKLIQRYDSYAEDMKKCFDEIVKVTKDDAIIIFVVGDKKRGNEIINGGDYFSNLFDRKPTYIAQREYTNTPSKIWDKINKTHRKEQIIVWDKSTW
ncbi:MAG: modification methylase [Candidatus Saccharicenans subterraneus]|uniref:Modification methylase n=1 Tax=Candidatus Saccharicenans subterraneus TaxID=2508984 RepID=A0A3E2BNS9_9BACT|nr:MAG: modification methylase [Candidatus Saccharicenans subterraneum]